MTNCLLIFSVQRRLLQIFRHDLYPALSYLQFNNLKAPRDVSEVYVNLSYLLVFVHVNYAHLLYFESSSCGVCAEMLPVSLDCPFLIALSVFGSNVYQTHFFLAQTFCCQHKFSTAFDCCYFVILLDIPNRNTFVFVSYFS